MRYLHTMLRVRDLDAALDFFVAKLGLKEVRRQRNEGGRFTLVFLGSGAAGDAAPGMATNGKPGPFSGAAAAGGQTSGGADGGNGGNGMTTSGATGGGSGTAGGGGGGSVGRIRVETQSGSATLDAGSIISPGPIVATVDIH